MSTTAPNSILISSVPDLQAFVASITPSETLYVDLEGDDLSRHGTISLITILVYPQRTTRLIDVLILGRAAFTTTTNNGKSLKAIFEDSGISKYFWDVRNDADALWALYGVGLAGVTDVQLLENSSRPGDKTHLHSLAKCVQLDLRPTELYQWMRIKEGKQKLLSTKAFATRPLDTRALQYCVNDVAHLPRLRSLYLKRIKDNWLAKAMDESSHRVLEARSADYKPQSPKKHLGPWGAGTSRTTLTMKNLPKCFMILKLMRCIREMASVMGKIGRI